MAADASIQTSNVPWQVRQGGKNLSEWIQLQLSRQQPRESEPFDLDLPVWIAELILWLVIAGAIVWVAWVLVQALERYLAYRQGRQPQAQVYTVPQVRDRSAADWLRQAQQFEREGDWRAACRALYMAALQVLADRDWVPHLPSRTDGEYLQAVQPLSRPRPLQLLIRTHERSLFGGDRLTAENVQRCRRAYEELDKR
ncbi:MAG: DUF4129 domain-containing protein [Leptolyngbyaceae cyanobacterium]